MKYQITKIRKSLSVFYKVHLTRTFKPHMEEREENINSGLYPQKAQILVPYFHQVQLTVT